MDPGGDGEVQAPAPEAATKIEGGETGTGAAWPNEVAPGRLIVMFFQTDYEPSRLIGLIRMAAQARQFLYKMLPSDRVAVASFDSHLKLRQDFTDDHDKIERAINASLMRKNDAGLDPDSHPALGRHLDLAAARKASTPERALALLADALTPIPGGKSMLYFGWGLGTVGGLSGPNPAEARAWRDAMRGMAAARVSIFTLDVTDADFHSLEVYLEQISDLTGGRYEKTHIFPGLAMQRVERAISGRYVLVFVKPRSYHGAHAIDVDVPGHKARTCRRGSTTRTRNFGFWIFGFWIRPGLRVLIDATVIARISSASRTNASVFPAGKWPASVSSSSQ